MTDASARRHPLYPSARLSPYFPRTEAAGATEYIVYNHMYMPIAYGRDPREDYRALTERVVLWDVGAERQTELRGPDAMRLAGDLTTRRIDDLGPGDCRYTVCCDDLGAIICDPVMLVPEPDVVWLSHGTVDLTLWARAWALGGGYHAEVTEPDVAPVQVQGPAAPTVLRSVAGDGVDALGRFRCAAFTIAGTGCVVSRTGWSGGEGYEVFPRSSAGALAVWDAIVEAGRPHGLLVSAPDVGKALESGITDTGYGTNQGLNPLELWQDYLVDFDGRRFAGRDALERVRDAGVTRRQVGLLGPPERLPRCEWLWDVRAQGTVIGQTRWVAYSLALERTIAIGVVEAATAAPGTAVTVAHPEGDAPFEVAALPFVR